MHMLAILVLAAVAVLHEQSGPTDAETTEAISLGLAKKTLVIEAGHTFGRSRLYDVYLLGPLARVAQAARAAAKKFMPFALSDVTDEMRRPVVTVVIAPRAPVVTSSGTYVAEAVRHIVLRPKSGAVVQPIEVQFSEDKWGNALGGEFQTIGAVALFPIEQFPRTAFDVSIVTDSDKPINFDVGEKDARKVR